MTDFPTHAIDAPPFFRALALCAIGAIWGSFLQAVLDRRRIRQKQIPLDGGDQFAQRLKKLNSLSPSRSFCFACGSQLAWYDNIPIWSYCWLQGRCRLCRVPFSNKSFRMELGLALGLGILGWSIKISCLLGALTFLWVIVWTVFLNAPSRRVAKSK
ncbi:MAG: prepilin peptidase [Deltaproteobacteria bacterium]|nr:prepilin peptidase [Deltaproteobacteria bacterium]MBT7202718.1 prepilin peptidase [Deltaproteobacteria bacterium]